MRPIPDAEKPWLKRFFSSPNALQWDQIIDGAAPPGWLSSVTPWLDFLSSQPVDRPLLLPVFSADGTRQWYGMAANDQIAAQLLEEVRAFVGPSFSQFSGHWHASLGTDVLEVALQERFGWRVLRIDPSAASDRGNIEQSIARYRDLLSRRPPIPDRTLRPFATIRSDFDLALLAGSAERAQQYLEELLGSGRVGTDQHRFLRIRFLAGLGRIEELAHDRVLIESVMNLALPRQILVDLVEGLYETHIEPHERRLELADLAALFERHIARPFGALFRERKGIRRPRVLRAFFLFEAGQEDRSDSRCKAIADTYPKEDANLNLIERWLRAVVSGRPGVPADRVRQAIVDED